MKRIKTVGVVFVTAAVLVNTVFLIPNNSIAVDTSQNEKAELAPAWKLLDLNGKTVYSSDFKGKVIVLNFWATWCPPCRKEIPGFIKLQDKYRAQGLAIVGVSVDQDGLSSVKRFVRQKGINYAVVMANTNVIEAFGGIDSLPTTFVISRTGELVKEYVTLTDEAEIETEIKPLLSQ